MLSLSGTSIATPFKKKCRLKCNSKMKIRKRNCYNQHVIWKEWDLKSVEFFGWFAYLFAASPRPRPHFIPRQTFTDTGCGLEIQGSWWTKETERGLKGVRDNDIINTQCHILSKESWLTQLYTWHCKSTKNLTVGKAAHFVLIHVMMGLKPKWLRHLIENLGGIYDHLSKVVQTGSIGIFQCF